MSVEVTWLPPASRRRMIDSVTDWLVTVGVAVILVMRSSRRASSRRSARQTS